MASKTKPKAGAKAGTSKGTLDQLEKGQRKQQRLLDKMQQREDWMRWLIIGLIILLILLILFFGYATDWTKGLRKDAATTNDAGTTSATGSGTDSTSTTPAGTGSGSGSTGSNNTGTNSTGSTTTGTNSTSKESSTSSTNTSNTSTTTNNTTTPSDNAITSLYKSISVGETISSVLDQVPAGVSTTCHTDILVQICDFTEDGLTVTTKNLLGSGLITSVTNNF